MTKKQMVFAVTLAAAGAGWMGAAHAAERAEEMPGYALPDIVVEGERSAESDENRLVSSTGGTGFLGTKDVMDVPFHQTNITNKAITQYDDGMNTLPNALLMSPSVRTSGSTLYNDFSIRGFAMNAYQFKINGVPGMFTQMNTPANFVERIEVIAGPAIGIHGTASSESAGGSVNLVTKKAAYDKERIIYQQTINGRGALGEIFDIGKRFGRNAQWGIRVSAENIQGKTAVEREKMTTRDFYINLDHQGAKSTTNLFAGYRYSKNEGGQRYFAFDGAGANAYTGDRLPAPPSGRSNYSFNGAHLTMTTWTAVLNHEQRLSERWKAFLNAGSSYNHGRSYVMTNASRVFMLNEDGDFQNALWTNPFAVRNNYVQLGVRGAFDIGPVKNDMVLALDRDWYYGYWGYEQRGRYGNQVPVYGRVSGSLRDGIRTLVQNYDPATISGPIKSGATIYSGISVTDTLTYGKASVLLGVHHHSVKATSYSNTSGYKDGKTVSSSANSPTYGIVYKPTEDLSLYANHSESFDKGTAVGGGYMNTGRILSPAKTKQNEIGVKYRKDRISAGLSLFQIEQDRTMDVTYVGDARPTKVMEGKNKLKGVELSVSRQIAPKWTLTGGLMHLATEQKTNTVLDGRGVSGIADWSGMLAAEYAADAKTAAFMRMVYSGKAPIYTSAAKQLDVPSYVTVDLGVTYQTTLGTVPTTLSLTAYNVLDKRYWMSRPGYNYGIQGYPRSFVMSLTMML